MPFTAFAAPADVRLLIDVSGSMRQNDPQNLRAPALQIVNELIPLGTSAGVWLFAEQQEILATPAIVDADWKKRLRDRLARIHSRGRFTDIEGAIRAATADWTQAPAAGERHLIILTDGLVDISKDATESAASRERILSEQITALKTQGVKVHTIGLSNQIDEPLMRQLAKETDGWLEIAQDADSLQRLFLRMLEESAPPTTVPIAGNQFTIDEQVREFTLLAFRAQGGKTELITPTGERIRADQPLPDVKWRAELSYDLVTLANPKPGQWRILGVEDPDNRVVIVTALNIEAAPVPNAVMPGETVALESWLTEHGQPITRTDLLQLLNATCTLTPEFELPANAAAPVQVEEGEQPPAPRLAPTQLAMSFNPATNRFAATLQTQTLIPGVYRLDLVIDGGTFQRQLTQRLKIKDKPLTITYEQQLPSDIVPFAAILLRLAADQDVLDTLSVSGYLLARGPNGWSEVVELPKGKRFPLLIKIPIQRPGDYTVTSHFIANRLSGDMLEIQPEPCNVNFEFDAPPEPSATPEAPLSWGWLALYLLGGNALLGVALGLTWWLMVQRARPAAQDVIAKTAANSAGSGKRTSRS
ncbi:vWA domain-containing protein [Allochromatium warmingii]|nr:vWA domain-containing protein [Allochromatium warmingii]